MWKLDDVTFIGRVSGHTPNGLPLDTWKATFSIQRPYSGAAARKNAITRFMERREVVDVFFFTDHMELYFKRDVREGIEGIMDIDGRLFSPSDIAGYVFSTPKNSRRWLSLELWEKENV